MKKPRLFYGWWIVVASVLVGLYVGGIVVYGFTAIFDPIVEEFGWSYATVSFAASLRGAESGLLEPIVGRLVDRWGPRRLIFAGGLATTAGLLLLSHTMTLVMFYGSFVLLAVGFSCCGTTVLVSSVANWFRARLAFTTGITLSGFGLGGLLLPVVVTLIERHGWRDTYEILAIGALALVLPLSLLFRHKPEEYGYRVDGRKPEPVTESSPPRARMTADSPPMDVREAVRTRSFWLLTFAFTVHTATVITVVSHVMPYLDDVGVNRVNAGVIAASIPVLSIMGRLGMGLMGDRLRRTRVTVLGYLLVGIGLLCFAAVPTLGTGVLYLFVLLFGVGYGGATALRPALTREYFGGRHFGSIFGLLIGINAIGGIVGPPLAGWSYDTSGQYPTVWIVFAGLAILSACLILLTERDKPHGQAV